MTIKFEHGPWRVATDEDQPLASYEAADWLKWSGPVQLADSRSSSVRAVVEVMRRGVGVRALIGGELHLTGDLDREVSIEVSSQKLTLGASATVPSFLWGSLVPGLPTEFAVSSLDGIAKAEAGWNIGGLLVVDRGAYHEVDSSPIAFEMAGTLLIAALLAKSRGSDLDESAVLRILPK